MSAVLLRKRRLKLGRAALLFLLGLAPGVAFAVPPPGDGQAVGTGPDFVLLNPRYYGDAIRSSNPATRESAINLGNAAMTLVVPASGKGAENLPVPSFSPLGGTADRQAGRPSSDSYAAWGIDGPPLPLPLPKIKIKPVTLTMASPIQVSAASPGATGTKASPANPALTLSTKAAQKSASVPTVKANAGAAPIATAAAASAPSVQPSSQVASQAPKSQTPTPRKSPSSGIQIVKDAAPIHRTSQPATDKVPASIASAPSPSPAASSPPSTATTSPLGAVADPHSLPEYSLVQPVAQPASPAPVGSLAPNVLALNGIQGSTVDVNLPGRGWIYTGTGQTPAGVSFMEKSAQASSERFRFRMDATGTLSLQFQRQDLSSGLVERGVANITVSAKGPQFSAANMGVLPINTTAAQAGSQSAAYQPQFPVPGERSIRPQGANNSGTLNSANSVAYSTQVPNAGLLQTAAVPDPSPAPELVPTDAPGIFALAQAKAQAKAWTDARGLYEKLLKDFPAFEKTDEVIYRLAQLLESNSDQRSLKDAYALYVRIQNEYPYGAWVDPAKERARYISRTFFRP